MRSQSGRGAFAWVYLAPALAFAQAPAAEPPKSAVGAAALTLRWLDPAALSPTSEAEFEAQLSERLGRPAFEGGPTGQALSVDWQGSAEQCRVELLLLSDERALGTRVIESPSGDCRALLPALLTVAALLIESRPLEPEVASVEAPAPPPAAAAAAADPDPRAPRREPLVLLSLGAELGAGLTPKSELGPAAAVVVAPFRHFRVGMLGSVYLPRQYGSAPGLELEHALVAAMACGMPLSGSFGLGVCGNAKLHRFESIGIALPYPEQQRSLLWTLGLALRAEWRLVRRLWWVGSVGADVTTEPLRFYFTPATGGQSHVFQQQRVAAALFLGLTLELP